MFEDEILTYSDELFSIFKDLHQHPEIGYCEERTAKIVAEKLREYGLSVTEGVAITGVVGVLDSGRPGKTLMIRADMDCLAVEELAQSEYKSLNPGKMHACGHDAHVSMLLLAAKVLSRHRDAFCGKIKFVFQPAEEGIPPSERERVDVAGYSGEGGAGFMIQEGVLDGVDACLIMHVQPSVPVGKVLISKRNACASSDLFRISIIGKGGHGAQPQSAIDPVPALAELITAIHMLPTREVSAVETCVISIGSVETPGSVWNAVAEKACMAGGLRTFNNEVRAHLNKRIKELARNIAAANRCTVKIDHTPGYSACINDERMSSILNESCKKTLGDENIIYTDVPAMTSEDCGAYMEKVPGAFFWLGVGRKEGSPALHSPYFSVDEDALVCGVKVHINAAIDVLAALNGGKI